MRYAEATFPTGGQPLERKPAIPNSVFGMIVFVMSELMFFASLISAFLISSSGSENWLAEGQPRLPVEATAFNSIFLFASAVTFYLGVRRFQREGDNAKIQRLLLVTLLLGAAFVALQGAEWVSLIKHGLTLRSSISGSFFYLIVGTHALHAIGAVLGLGRVYLKARKGTLALQSLQSVQVFWYFVVGLWPVLYVLVYVIG